MENFPFRGFFINSLIIFFFLLRVTAATKLE
jgi:hypothetical protein